MTSQRVERTWIRTGGYGRFRGEWVKLRINMKISARKGGYPLFHMVNCISHRHTPFSISVPNPHSGSSSRCDDLISNITLYKTIRIGYHDLNNFNQAREQTSYIVMLIRIFSLSQVIYNNCQSKNLMFIYVALFRLTQASYLAATDLYV